LNSDFHATGGVWFIGAKVGGFLDCEKGQFEAKYGGHALMMEGTTIQGHFNFRNVTSESGLIDLLGLHVAMLVDDIESWEKADGRLVLDGFRYDRIAGERFHDRTSGWVEGAPVDSKSRIRWLYRQRPEDLGTRFKPQPWEQIIKVLREMGHQEAAKEVAIEKQRCLEAAKKIAFKKQEWPRRSLPLLRWRLLWLYGKFCRYGYRPELLIVWALGFAVGFALIFKLGGYLGVMGPTDRRIIEEVKDGACRPEYGGNWTTCSTLKNRKYPDFYPLIYSFDLMFPFFATQQSKDWAPLIVKPCSAINRIGLCRDPLAPDVTATTSGYSPLGSFFGLIARLENLLGWIFGFGFVAVVSGLIKKD
jgi:hypothetical protein